MLMVRQRPSGPRLNRLQSKLWECALALDPRHAEARLDGGLRAALSASEAEESATAFAALVDSLPGASPDAALPVHRLAPRERAALVLCDLGDLEDTVIAGALNTTLHDVRALRWRARLGLLGEDDPGVGRGQLGQLLGWVESRLEEADRVRLSRDLDADAELRDLVDGMRADRAALQHRGEIPEPPRFDPSGMAARPVLLGPPGLPEPRRQIAKPVRQVVIGGCLLLLLLSMVWFVAPRPGSSWFNRSATASVQSTATWPPPGLQAYPRPQRPVAVQSRPEQSPREGEAVATFFCRVPAGLMAEGMLEPIAPQDALASFGITHLLRVDAEDAPEAMASLVDRAGGAFQVLRLPPMAADGRVVGEAAVLDFVAAQRLVQQWAEQARRSVVAKVPLQLR